MMKILSGRGAIEKFFRRGGGLTASRAINDSPSEVSLICFKILYFLYFLTWDKYIYIWFDLIFEKRLVNFIFSKYYEIFQSGPSVQLFCFQVLLWKTMQGKQEIKARTGDIRKIWTSHKIYIFQSTLNRKGRSFHQTILDLHNKNNGLFKIEFLPKILIF